MMNYEIAPLIFAYKKILESESGCINKIVKDGIKLENYHYMFLKFTFLILV